MQPAPSIVKEMLSFPWLQMIAPGVKSLAQIGRWEQLATFVETGSLLLPSFFLANYSARIH